MASGFKARTDWVFCTTEGRPMNSLWLSARFRRRFLPKVGVARRVRLYDLRHTCATLLLLKGVHPKVVAERLGHANIAMTLQVYSHVLPTMQQDATTKLNALYESPQAPGGTTVDTSPPRSLSE